MDEYRYIKEQYQNSIRLLQGVLCQTYYDLKNLNFFMSSESKAGITIELLYKTVDFINSQDITTLCRICNIDPLLSRQKNYEIIKKNYQELKNNKNCKYPKSKKKLLKAYELVINNYENGK